MNQAAQALFITCECGASVSTSAKGCPKCSKPLEARTDRKFNCKACKAELSVRDQVRNSRGEVIGKGTTEEPDSLKQIACPKCGEPEPFDTTLMQNVEKLYALTLYSGAILGLIAMVILTVSDWAVGAVWLFVSWIGVNLAVRRWRNGLRTLGLS